MAHTHRIVGSNPALATKMNNINKKLILLFVVLLSCYTGTKSEHIHPYMALKVCAKICVDDEEDIKNVRSWYYPAARNTIIYCTCSDGKKFNSGALSARDIEVLVKEEE